MRLNIRKKNGYGLNVQRNNLLRIYYEKVPTQDVVCENEVPVIKFVEINSIEPDKLNKLVHDFEKDYVQLKGLIISFLII